VKTSELAYLPGNLLAIMAYSWVVTFLPKPMSRSLLSFSVVHLIYRRKVSKDSRKITRQ